MERERLVALWATAWPDCHLQVTGRVLSTVCLLLSLVASDEVLWENKFISVPSVSLTLLSGLLEKFHLKVSSPSGRDLILNFYFEV